MMRLLQSQDVARRLGVATSTVRRWAADGVLPFRWAGKYRVFDSAEARRLAKKLGERAEARARRKAPPPADDPVVPDVVAESLQARHGWGGSA